MEFWDEQKVRAAVTYEALIPAVEKALIGLSTGTVRQPVRSVARLEREGGILGLMPAADDELIAVKLVTIYEDNRELPTHQAVIQLFAAKTGEPLMAMDGRLITEMRTAAVSAVATRLLARKYARVLAILGSGVQARAHVRALRMVRDFAEVRVWSRTVEHARRFAEECGARVAGSAEGAVRDADVVVTAANVREPLLRGARLRPGMLVCAVGAVGAERRELDNEAMHGQVVVESRAAAARESGDLIGSGQPVTVEIGELLSEGRTLPGEQGWFIFKSLGVGAADLAGARLVWEAVRESGTNTDDQQ